MLGFVNTEGSKDKRGVSFLEKFGWVAFVFYIRFSKKVS